MVDWSKSLLSSCQLCLCEWKQLYASSLERGEVASHEIAPFIWRYTASCDKIKLLLRRNYCLDTPPKFYTCPIAWMSRQRDYTCSRCYRRSPSNIYTILLDVIKGHPHTKRVTFGHCFEQGNTFVIFVCEVVPEFKSYLKYPQRSEWTRVKVADVWWLK